MLNKDFSKVKVRAYRGRYCLTLPHRMAVDIKDKTFLCYIRDDGCIVYQPTDNMEITKE